MAVSRALLLLSSVSAIAGLLYGYDLGLIGGAMLGIRRDLHANLAASAAIVSAAKAGAVCGTFLGGASMYKFGRLRSISVASAFFVVGPLLMALASSIAQLIVGRFVIGIGIGVSAVVVPAYLGELAPPAQRGAIVLMYEAMLCLGMLASILVDALLEGLQGDWRYMTGAPLVPALLLAAAPLLLPESPRWLLMKGNVDEARSVLRDVHASKSSVNGTAAEAADRELLLVLAAVENRAPSPPSSPLQQSASHRDLPVAATAQVASQVLTSGVSIELPTLAAGSKLSPCSSRRSQECLVPAAASAVPSPSCAYDLNRPFHAVLFSILGSVGKLLRGPERQAVIVAIMLAFFNQISASTSIISYAPDVLQRVGVLGDRSAILISAFIGGGKAAGVIAGVALVDVVGRRPLLLCGSAACAVAMFGLAVALHASSIPLTVACMVVYITAFSMSWAGVFWVILAELFSMASKSAAMSIATAALFYSGALADVLFPVLLHLEDMLHASGGTFVVFGMMSVLGGVYVWAELPETKGLSLLEVQAALAVQPRRGQFHAVSNID